MGEAQPQPTSVLLTVAYDGGQFVGFAPQREGRTIYGTLLAAIRALDPSVETLRGASRTDSGVHAQGQRVAFDPSRDIPLRGWVLGVNTHLPVDVAIRQAQAVPRGFEPRASGLGKRYRYLLLRDALRDPRYDRYAYRIDAALDLAKARAEAHHLLGTHDFRAFRSSRDPRVDTTRTITRADCTEGVNGDPRLVAIDIEGSAFLHNMVRIITGTMVDVGRGFRAPGAIACAIRSGRREDLGMTAPPHALSLEEVHLLLPLDLEGAVWP
ncbi:MAG: tRNA pseudouridine(38-40) synthase TruA [Polyangiales bacterium]